MTSLIEACQVLYIYAQIPVDVKRGDATSAASYVLLCKHGFHYFSL